ncbi:MAG: trypsin-like peptidase domain-containing protein [bacterium]|nr:trypsin-like peptidase domain-containing protein [bacterium]
MKNEENAVKYKNKQVERVKKPFNPALVAIMMIVALGTISGGGIVISRMLSKQNSSSSSSLNSSTDGNSSSFKGGESSSIEQVAKKLSKSVVSIVGKAQSSSSFFYKSSGTATAGTGVIATADGYIITNKHVVENSSNISVILSDGTTYNKVRVVAKDPLNDIAYLKIDGVSNLQPAELGDSKTLNIGQEVIAIGNALGQYDGTVTRGIISGVNRTVTASSDGTGANAETLSDMIQTDAAINSGNSGGPLVNAQGQVIGINTAVVTDAQGIGFALPISSAKGMLKSLIENGTARRASLGISYTPVTAAVAKENNLSTNSGAWVQSKSGSVIKNGGAAQKAGVKEGDIITAVNGVKIGSAGSVSSLVAEYQPGDTVKLTVVRDGKELELTATLDAYSGV